MTAKPTNCTRRSAEPAQPRRCQAHQRPSQQAQPRFSQVALCNSLDDLGASALTTGRRLL